MLLESELRHCVDVRLTHEGEETGGERALDESRAERPEGKKRDEESRDPERRQRRELAFDDQVKEESENSLRERGAESDGQEEHDSENDCAHAVSIGRAARKSSPPAAALSLKARPAVAGGWLRGDAGPHTLARLDQHSGTDQTFDDTGCRLG